MLKIDPMIGGSVQLIRGVVRGLRFRNVPYEQDGYYHVEITAEQDKEIYSDSELKLYLSAYGVNARPPVYGCILHVQ